MDYKSPIEIMQAATVYELEGEVMRATVNVGVHVDKEELIKALAYDRDQYIKGYKDAKAKYKRPCGEWSLRRTIKRGGYPEHELVCSECGAVRNIRVGETFPVFCERCGADNTEHIRTEEVEE